MSRNNRSREQERKALLSYAFFRWESAVTLAMMLILAIFLPDPFRGTMPFWGWWMWIGLGVLAEVLIVGTTLTDRDLRARIAGQLIRARFDLDGISDDDLRQRVVKALDTREQMEVVFQRSQGTAAGAQLVAMGDHVSKWVNGMYRLARRVDEVRDHAALHRYRDSMPAEIQALEGRLAAATGAPARAELERALAGKRALLGQLERLDGMVESAGSQLDENLSALEAIYSQMQLVAARGADSRRVQQLRDAIDGHAHSLSELDREIAERFEQIQ